MKRVLVLGAGLVAGPLVRYLLEKGFSVSVTSLDLADAKTLIDLHPCGVAHELDVDDEEKLAAHIEESDLVVSLLPYLLHPRIARLCLAHGKSLVTTSYVSDEMFAFNEEARARGLLFLNELGVDPGVDHMEAMRIIDRVAGRGGRVTSFRSYCGGLPAPDSNDNPFGYKFSWSPRGVLLAGRNNARYRLRGRLVSVEAARLFRDMHVCTVDGAGDFEAYPNRDSTSYIGIYGLDGIETMYRGTLRNMGWCDCMYNFGRLGLLSLEPTEAGGMRCKDFMRGLVGARDGQDIELAVAERLGICKESLPMHNLRWLGMFSEEPIEEDVQCPLDVLGARMRQKLRYESGERDMVVLLHDFEAEYRDGRKERIKSQLVVEGMPNGSTAMARAVSLPAAIAARLMLEGKVNARGVVRPVSADLYQPILDELAGLGIECQTTAEKY